MAINIGENNDKEVTYVNSPDINRVLFKNLSEGASADEIAEAVNAWIEEHPEAVTTVQDGSILPVKLDSSNEPSDGYVLSWNATAGKFEWIDLVGEVTELKADFNELGEDLDAAVNTVITDTVVDTRYNRSDLTAGVINVDGTATSGGATGYTQPFAVNPGDKIKVNKYYLDSKGQLSDPIAGVFGTYAYLADDGVTYLNRGAGWNANASEITIPDGIHYIQVTVNAIMTGTYNIAIITITTPNGTKTNYLRQTCLTNPSKYKGTLTANTAQPISTQIIPDTYILTATIKTPSSFSSLKVGGLNSAGNDVTAPYVEITPTKVNLKSNTSDIWDRSYDHGLTIGDDVQVIIMTQKNNLYASVIVQSGGDRWVSTANTMRIGAIYYGFGIKSAEAVSEAFASVSIVDLYKPVWVCGDSWVTYFEDRWYGQAVDLGIDGFLHLGRSGEGSKSGLVNLKTALSMYTPKMIVWLYGMNDADTNDSTPNAQWLAALTELETICSNRTIELVLATIPTTPTRNNNAKNAVVTASDYRYVDEVAAMGADTSGNWITGYQSEDGNHTTVAGARALLAQVLADVPEIGIK